MAAFKPAFTISDKQILWNLHKASFAKLKQNYSSIVEVISNKLKELDPAKVNATKGFDVRGIKNNAIGKEVEKSFNNKDFTYQTTIYYKFYVSLISTAKNTTVQPSASDIAKAKKEALDILQEYFTVFCGSDLAKKIKETDLQESKLKNEDIKGFSVTYTVGAKAK